MIEIESVILEHINSARNGKISTRHIRFSHPTQDKTVGAVVQSNRRLKNTSKFLDVCTAIDLIRNGKFPDRVNLLLCTGTVIEREGEIIVPCIVKNQNGHGAKYHVGFRRQNQIVGRAYAVGVFE